MDSTLKPHLPSGDSLVLLYNKNNELLIRIRGDGNVEIHGEASEAARHFWSLVRDNVKEDLIYSMAFNAGVASVKGPLVS